MSWRTGSKLFIAMWPLIQRHIQDKEERIEFTSKLLEVFSDEDMDTWEVEDIDPDIRAALRLAGIEIAESEKYKDDEV